MAAWASLRTAAAAALRPSAVAAAARAPRSGAALQPMLLGMARRGKADAAAVAGKGSDKKAKAEASKADAGKGGGADERKKAVRLSTEFFKQLEEMPEMQDTDFPFEDNPEFRRHRPLSDATKEKIFQAITSNPTENPPRKVAAKFGISLERLDAIVRLKKLEREMVENGFVVDAELTKSMEEFVSATDVVQRPGDDDASSEDTPYLFPNYLLLQEREPVPADLLARWATWDDGTQAATGLPEPTATAAAAKPAGPVAAKGAAAAAAAAATPTAPAEVLEKNEALAGGRYDFVFTTFSNDRANTDVYVRDRDGALRRTTLEAVGIRHGKPRPKKTNTP